MPTNAMRIQRMADQSFEVTVWGPDGVPLDLTPHFEQIIGPEAPSTFSHQIQLKDGDFKTAIEFTASEMDLRYQLKEDVARLLVAVAGAT